MCSSVGSEAILLCLAAFISTCSCHAIKAAMETYPDFSEAVDQFKEFLAAQECPTSIQWAFRENVYFKSQKSMFVAAPLPSSNADTAARAYFAGVSQEQIAVRAIARSTDSVVATVWYPISEQQRPQGWEKGLRFAIVDPLPVASEVPIGWRWTLRTMPLGFRRLHQPSDILKSEDIN